MIIKTGTVPNKEWNNRDVFLLLAGVFYCVFFSHILLGFFRPRIENFFADGGQLFSVVFSTFAFQGATVLLIALFLYTQKMSWKKAFGFHIGSPLTVLTQGFFLGVAAFPVSLLLVALIRWILEFLQLGAESQEVIKMLQQKETGAWGQIVFIGVLSIFIAPIAEEILFRGVIYVHVRDMGFPKIAALGSAVLFGMVHSNTVAFIPLVLFALFLILLYERYSNLIVCIAAHASFNTANLLFSILLSGENMT